MSALCAIPYGSVSGDYRASAAIRLYPGELSARQSIEWIAYYDDGLGQAVGAAFQVPNGQCFGLVHHFHTRKLGHHGTSILTLHRSPEEAETLDLALCALHLTTDDLLWIREDLLFAPYDLIRQDDHGNQFRVSTHRCRADATAEQRKFAVSFHKQDYWVRAHERFEQWA